MPLDRLLKWSPALSRMFRKNRDYHELQETICYSFKDVSLITEALSHRSYVRTANNPQSLSFERLEFLGDSVLGMLVAEQLFILYPDMSEGELTKLKAALVNEQTLAMIARGMGLGKHIKLSEDEAKAGGRDRPSITSDCFEALLAAIYLDGGIVKARSFIQRFVLSRIADVQNDSSIKNYKGELLELIQGTGAGVPHYEVLDGSGPDHDKVFTVTVYGFDLELAQGKGHSKKEAEQDASHKALPKAKRIAEERRSKLAGQEDR